jgi:hypothetical protein
MQKGVHGHESLRRTGALRDGDGGAGFASQHARIGKSHQPRPVDQGFHLR